MINLLALWRAHGLDAILREAWQAGIVLAGLSAGSMCWFEGGITNGARPAPPAAGLGFLPGSNSVHYDGEPERRPAFLEAVAAGALPAGYGVDDGVGLLFRGTRLAEVVAGEPGARAYRVDAVDGAAREHELEPRVLAGGSTRRPGRCRMTSGSCGCSGRRRELGAHAEVARRRGEDLRAVEVDPRAGGGARPPSSASSPSST